jgi:hypothetical protein
LTDVERLSDEDIDREVHAIEHVHENGGELDLAYYTELVTELAVRKVFRKIKDILGLIRMYVTEERG